MNSALLQLKIDPALKDDLETLADYKGISLSALAKMILKEMVRQEKKQLLTENGLTLDQELVILQREQEALQDFKKGKCKALSGKELLKELNA